MPSILQQKKFWNCASKIIKNFLKNNNNKIFISTHGHGVPYFHLRISKKPKYYFEKDFI